MNLIEKGRYTLNKTMNIRKKIAIALAAFLLTAGVTGTLTVSPDHSTGTAMTVSAAESEAGIYSVNMTLMQFHSDEVSMGNASMEPEAHITVNTDGTATFEIDMHSMTYLNKDGYLGWLKKVTAVLAENKYQYPTEIETLDAIAVEEYTDVYDIFNDPSSEYADENVVGKWYPKKLSIPIDFANREDEILVQVYVPVMESIMEGGGTKFAVIDIDWDTLEQIEAFDTPEETTATEETTTTTETTSTTVTETTTTTTTETTPTVPTSGTNLEDGKYELQAEMIKVDRESYSMSNNAINHTVQLDVVNGEYYVTVQFKGLSIYNQFGYLQDLYYYNSGYTYNEYGQPQGDVTKAEVLSTYDAVDQYNDADHLYPQLEKFPLVYKGAEEYVPLRVFVPIMEAIADGTGTQNVLMKLDWSTLTKTEEPFQIEEQEEQSKAFDYTDSATGVKLHADQGVLPNDAAATVSEITSGADYDTAKDNLSNFKLYSVSVSADLNGKMQVSLPIPSGVSEPVVYRITDGKKTKINGTVADGMFTFQIKDTGNFAIGSASDGTNSQQNKTTTTTSANGKNTSSSTAPATGDAGVGAIMAGLTAATAAAYLTRRKNK